MKKKYKCHSENCNLKYFSVFSPQRVLENQQNNAQYHKVQLLPISYLHTFL